MDMMECRPGLPPVAVWAVPALMLCLLLPAARPAYAQFGEVRSAERLETGQTINFFASWGGNDVVHGFAVELPQGWVLRGASLLRYGYEPVPVEVERDGRSRFVVSSARVLQGPHELVLRVETGETAGTAEWSLVPLARPGAARAAAREAYRVSRAVRVGYPESPSDNRVMSFAEPGRPEARGAPLLLRRSALPDLGLRAAYTVSFWVKTTGLNEVVASTWDGDERQAYPLEFVVDRSGRLLVYRGQPGSHQSVTSRLPVADGQWHHVAFTNDPESGWARLYLDGLAVDSLFSSVPPGIDWRTPLAVGGRVPSSAGGAGQLFYTGLLDELTLLPGARPAAAIRSAMRQPASDVRNGGGVRIGFEEPVAAALVERRSARTQRVYSDLSFFRPVRALRAEVEGRAVRLSWEADDGQTVAFVVERSADGQRFVEIGRLSPDPGGVYRFRDEEVPGQVVFYRVRQVFSGESERTSGTIKLGLGPDELPEQAALMGNFPNPFNAATTVAYELRESMQVRLSVWDLSGHLLVLLVSQVQPAGTHEVRFEAGDLPSGTYFVRLETPHGVESHKMILMK